MGEDGNLMRIGAIIGAIVAIIESVLALFGLAIWMLWWITWYQSLIAIIIAVIIIILAIFLEYLPFNSIVVIVLSIGVLICSAWIGGLILLVSGLLFGLYLQ